jgi:hypothetical protein
LIHGRTRMSTNKQDLSLLRRYPWSSVTGRVLSGINPYTSMLVYRKYSYTDGHGLYTVTSVATRYLLVYSRNLGTNTVDVDPGEKLNVLFLALTARWSRTTPGPCTVYHGPRIDGPGWSGVSSVNV